MTAFRDRLLGFCSTAKGSKRKIAEFFLLNAGEAVFMSAEKVASRVGVSPSSVTRCVVDMGYDGYYDFLDALRGYVSSSMLPRERLTSHMGPGEKGDLYGFSESLENDCRNVDSVLVMNSPEDICGAVELLYTAKRIRLFSSRTSHLPLSLFALILSRVRPDVSMLSESGGLLPERLMDITPEDLLFLANLPRYTRVVLDIAQFAHEAGCRIIGVTDSRESPMLQYSDITLYVPYDSYSFFNSHIASLALYNALAAALAARSGNDTACRLEKQDDLIRRLNPMTVYSDI